MPIITIQRRMAEQGRIRLGEKKRTANGKEYPSKLSAFRFTSPSQRLIEEIASKYGGTARPWDNAGKSEWEVVSDATALPVIVVKGGFSQWHEHWTKAGCQHRCDGEKDAAGNYCDPDDEFHMLAIEKPTTRLSVMLSEIETLGVWRMESKGWNAAAELPSMAELAMHVGDLVPATLGLAERSSIIQTSKGPQTSRYVVPFLDLHVTKQRVVELIGGQSGAPGIEASQQAPAIEAPQPAAEPAQEVAQSAGPSIPTPEQIASADLAMARSMVAYLEGEGLAEHPAAQAARDRVAALAQPDTDGVVDAELVPDEQAPAASTAQPSAEPDPDAVWQQILTAASEKHGWGLDDVVGDFKTAMGLIPDEASGAELAAYLHTLTTGEEPAA